MALGSLFDSDFQAVYSSAARPGAPPPFPSPADWRDCPIYFLRVDRFNSAKPPAHQPFAASLHQDARRWRDLAQPGAEEPAVRE
jgi:hypothetical protein